MTFEKTLPRLLKAASILVASATLLASEAKADSYSVVYDIDAAALGGSNLTDWSLDFSLPKFDITLGTLTKVQIDFDADATTSLFVENVGNSSSTGDVRTDLTLDLRATNLSGNPGAVVESEYFVPGAKQFYTLNEGESVQFLDLTASDSSTVSYTNSGDLAQFQGPGSINYTASTNTQTTQSNTGGNTTTSQQTYANGKVTVTYTYTATAVPEPATWAAMTMGVGMLVLASRFRRRAA